MRYILLTLVLGLFFTNATWAQRIKKIEGDPKALSGETQLNVQFTYDNMQVGKYKSEAEYVEDKKADYNKKEEGRGEKWESLNMIPVGMADKN